MSSQSVANGVLGSYPVRVTRVTPGGAGVQTVTSGFEVPYYDYVAVTYPIATQEVYVFKIGGSGGTTVGTITLTYTDSTKENLSSAEKS